MTCDPSAPRYQGTTITAAPTLAAQYGRAWRLPLPDVGQRATPDQDGTVAGWLVHRPNAHPFWDHYLVCVVHLRPIAGAPPPKLKRPVNTHEIMFASLNPERALPSDLAAHDLDLQLLQPLDLVHQVEVENDAVADQLLTLIVMAILADGLSPDQDFRSHWRRHIDATVAHFNDGTHKVRLQ